jgi:hypothetical protein
VTGGRRQRARRKISVEADVLTSSEAMLRYALNSGLRIPSWVVDTVRRAVHAGDSAVEGTPLLSDGDFAALLRARAELVKIVAPATPRTIVLVSHGRRSRLSMLGPVRLIRHMLVAVLILLTAFVLLAMSPDVNLSSGNVLSASGTEVLLNELFFLAAGGLGAAFSALFTAYRYISDGTYDPKYESTYWVRFILGLMAGLLLPSLIPLGAEEGEKALSRPLLALLGGFSAAVLYRILERLVGAVESVVQADTREVRNAERELSTARAGIEAERERLALATQLRRLDDQARAEGAPSGVREGLDELLERLLAGPDDAADRAPEPPSPRAGSSPPAREP